MEADRVVSKCLDTLTEQKTQQEQILLRLLKALGELKEELGDVPANPELESRSDLRSTHIDRLKMTLDGLERVKQQRRREAQVLLPEVLQMCAEMREQPPDGLAELAVDMTNLPVRSVFLASLRKCHDHFHALKEERIKQLRHLKASISIMHAKLNRPPAELERFLLLVQSPEARCVEECKRELARLEEEKRASTRKLIQISLERIQDLWNQLNVGEDRRVLPDEVVRFLETSAAADATKAAAAAAEASGADGSPAVAAAAEAPDTADDAYMDRIFQLCEQEVERLAKLQCDLQPILTAIKERERLLAEREVFRVEEQDKNRFQHAGRMLEEEKKRRVFEKRLPTLEKSLAAMLKKWAAEHHERLHYGGVDYLAKMEDDARAERERLAAHRKQRALERFKAFEERTGLDPNNAAARMYSKILTGERNPMEQTFSSTMKMVQRRAATAGAREDKLGRTLPPLQQQQQQQQQQGRNQPVPATAARPRTGAAKRPHEPLTPLRQLQQQQQPVRSLLTAHIHAHTRKHKSMGLTRVVVVVEQDRQRRCFGERFSERGEREGARGTGTRHGTAQEDKNHTAPHNTAQRNEIGRHSCSVGCLRCALWGSKEQRSSACVRLSRRALSV